MEYDNGGFFLKQVGNFQVLFISDKNNAYFTRRSIYPIHPGMKNVSEKNCREIQKIFYFQ